MLAKDGLEAQLLARVVARERPDLQQAKSDLTTQGAEHRRLLQEIERKILNVLSTSEHLLEDEEAVQVCIYCLRAVLEYKVQPVLNHNQYLGIFRYLGN